MKGRGISRAAAALKKNGANYMTGKKHDGGILGGLKDVPILGAVIGLTEEVVETAGELVGGVGSAALSVVETGVDAATSLVDTGVDAVTKTASSGVGLVTGVTGTATGVVQNFFGDDEPEQVGQSEGGAIPEGLQNEPDEVALTPELGVTPVGPKMGR